MKIKFTLALFTLLFPALARGEEETISGQAIADRVFRLNRNYLAEFQHPETGILYGSRLAGKDSWTSPEEVLQEKPKPWGYGSRIADTVLHTGHMLVALIDAAEARPDPFLTQQIRTLFEAIQLIGSLPETHPKPGKPALTGLVPRGPHPDDLSAYFDDSSMDQHTTYIISLAVYANSSFATEDDKAWIRESLEKVGSRLEKHDWSIKRADGSTQAHVGFSWKGFNSNHASILLPSVLALYHGTGNPRWQEAYEHFLEEADQKRWQAVHPGPHVKINGHPIYANQNAFRVHAWHRFESDPERQKVIRGLLRQSTEMQLNRDFPGEFYRKYHSEQTWDQLSSGFNWGDRELRGAASAWQKFRPAMLERQDKGLATLAHVRFPLGGFHMSLLSENPELIRTHLPSIWKMLNTVDLQKIAAGETHYLFSVVALHLYAHYFREPDLFSDEGYGPELEIINDAKTGPVMDIAIEGNHAYAIGQRALHVLELRDRAHPTAIGKLTGIGSVRQIVVRDGIAYITSRQDGLFLVDVRTPSKPRLLYHYDTVEFATGIAISGNLLFVACRHYGVELIDISDPESPRHISTVRTGEAQSVVARNGYLYVGVWASSEVVTVDYHDPWNPRIVSRASLDGYGDGLDVEGAFLYVATGHHSRETPRKKQGDPGFGKGHGLEVFDLSDPRKPRFLSRVKFHPLYEIGNDMWGVTISNGHAFVADTYNGLFILDVSDPRSLKPVGHRKLPFSEARKKPGFVGGLAVTNDFVYLAGGFTDLHVVAAPDRAKTPHPEPDTPVTLGPRPSKTDSNRVYRPGGQVYGVDFLPNDRAIVACGDDGIHLVQLWPEVKLLSRLDTGGFATDVSVSGNTVFAAESAGGLGIYQVSDTESKLRRTGRFKPSDQAIRQVEISRVNDSLFAMLQIGANQFQIVDVSDPASPRQVLKDARHGLLYGDQMMRGLVENRYTCVFWHVSGLHWYDLAARPKPVFSGNHYPERIGSSNGLTAFQGKTLAMIRGGYRLLDRNATIGSPKTYTIKGLKNRIHPGVPTVAGNRLYTANRAYGILTIIDISNPESPRLVTQFETSGNPTRIAKRNDSLVIPNGYDGLLILDEAK